MSCKKQHSTVHNVISTGSQGNAVIYHGVILVDIGVPYSSIDPYINDIQIVLLSHFHQDHLNVKTLKKLCKNRPMLRIGCASFMLNHLKGINNIDVFEIGELYDYGLFSISPVKLYHDVDNVGYRIFKDDYKIFHATDTSHLEGISAKGYDLYAVEHNYNEDIIEKHIEKKESLGEFAHERRVFNTHLSEQQAREFIYKNKSENYEVLKLHEHKI